MHNPIDPFADLIPHCGAEFFDRNSRDYVLCRRSVHDNTLGTYRIPVDEPIEACVFGVEWLSRADDRDWTALRFERL